MDLDNKPSQETKDKWHSDPNNWKLGVFYFNKEDNRIFPPKRISGMGWTINFANPKSVLALVIMFMAIMITIRLVKQS